MGQLNNVTYKSYWLKLHRKNININFEKWQKDFEYEMFSYKEQLHIKM